MDAEGKQKSPTYQVQNGLSDAALSIKKTVMLRCPDLRSARNPEGKRRRRGARGGLGGLGSKPIPLPAPQRQYLALAIVSVPLDR